MTRGSGGAECFIDTCESHVRAPAERNVSRVENRHVPLLLEGVNLLELAFCKYCVPRRDAELARKTLSRKQGLGFASQKTNKTVASQVRAEFPIS